METYFGEDNSKVAGDDVNAQLLKTIEQEQGTIFWILMARKPERIWGGSDGR